MPASISTPYRLDGTDRDVPKERHGGRPRRRAPRHDPDDAAEHSFAEADAFSEVLVRAPSSGMVILSGELEDVPAESFMRMLAHRNPGLPVVSIDAPVRHEDG
jgi:hypothetical protein